jgi:transposase-like protein
MRIVTLRYLKQNSATLDVSEPGVRTISWTLRRKLMFTEAERIRAIELYFKYGRKLAPVVRELGYHPTKNALKRWYREYVEFNVPLTYICITE